ncbi:MULTISPECIES: hypothetical protein [Ectopseudomonas]|jgi:chorismate mutase|nr:MULTISPECIES: hypothetical protein [Pseudomonas]ALN21970.1 hypothetical protein DW68_025155 [Pseudomonas mendocina S5.2]KER97979.1 hypothetical protein HN51_24530 [Pseudomonas mendocina]NNB75167.1 hypothetical protein [Pseudomonas chengduensis]OEO24595.1 hypothetical protein AX279_18185 [Pseudomonas sp. J237]
MRFVAYKIVLLSFLILASGRVLALGGIPVECAGCEQASKDAAYNSANSIIDAIRSQTEVLVNAMDYVMRMEQAVVNERAKAEHKLSNSYQMDPDLGAKPRAACGQYAAAGMRKALENSSKVVQAGLRSRIEARNERSKNLAPGEPRLAYDVKEILEKMDKPEFKGAELLVQEEGIETEDKDRLAELLEALLMLLNPYPVSTPTAEEVERIKAHGTPAEKASLAEAVVMKERMQIGQQVFAEHFDKNLKKIDPKDLEYMLKDVRSSMSSDQQNELDSKLSAYELDELMATYRVRSEKWFTAVVANPSEAAAKKDALMMQAETLNQLWQLNKEVRKLVRLTAEASTRDVSQSGLMSR